MIDFSGVRRQRAAKEKVDYTSKGLRKRDLKLSYKNNPEDKKGSNDIIDDSEKSVDPKSENYSDEIKNERNAN